MEHRVFAYGLCVMDFRIQKSQHQMATGHCFFQSFFFDEYIIYRIFIFSWKIVITVGFLRILGCPGLLPKRYFCVGKLWYV